MLKIFSEDQKSKEKIYTLSRLWSFRLDIPKGDEFLLCDFLREIEKQKDIIFNANPSYINHKFYVSFSIDRDTDQLYMLFSFDDLETDKEFEERQEKITANEKSDQEFARQRLLASAKILGYKVEKTENGYKLEKENK
jgi:hypothetical protein